MTTTQEPISQLPSAFAAFLSDLLPASQVDPTSATGYTTRRQTIQQLLALTGSTQTMFNVKYPNFPGAIPAKGDGVTDDTLAIKTTVRAAYAAAGRFTGPPVIYFPAGQYRIAGNNPLGDIITPNPTAVANACGPMFLGDGKFNSVLVMDSSGASSPQWMLATPRTFTTYIGATFCFLGFYGSAPDSSGGWTFGELSPYSNGFQIFSSTEANVQNQNWTFISCAVRAVQTAFDFEGDAVASEIGHHAGTYGFVGTTFYNLNNPQSVNHKFFGTDIEEIYGNVFVLGAAGGGISVFGGSFILIPDGTSTDRWIVSAPATTAGDPIDFYSVRVELRGDYTNVLSLPNLSQTRVSFNGGKLLDQSVARTKTAWIQLGDYSRLDMSNVSIIEANGIPVNVHCYGTGLGGEVGTVLFDRCLLPQGMSDQCVIDYVGCISAYRTQGPTGATQYLGSDFTINGKPGVGPVASWSSAQISGDGGHACLQPEVKLAYLKAWPDYWPPASQYELMLELPNSAIIKAIHVLYAGGGLHGGSGVYVRVTNNNYSVTHLAGSIGDGGTAVNASVNDYYYSVGSAANDRTLRLSLGPISGASNYSGIVGSNAGGVVIVEYL